eukprot:6736550-Pyramimonas_sp.AAC.1
MTLYSIKQNALRTTATTVTSRPCGALTSRGVTRCRQTSSCSNATTWRLGGARRRGRTPSDWSGGRDG